MVAVLLLLLCGDGVVVESVCTCLLCGLCFRLSVVRLCIRLIGFDVVSCCLLRQSHNLANKSNWTTNCCEEERIIIIIILAILV